MPRLDDGLPLRTRALGVRSCEANAARRRGLPAAPCSPIQAGEFRTIWPIGPGSVPYKANRSIIASDDAILSLTRVGKQFAGLTALEDVTLTVRRGGIFGILGPNGAGKTTLFNLIAGALLPSTGEIRLNDRDITRARPDERCRRGLARTFQVTQPFLDLTVEENIMCGAFSRFRSRRAMKEATAHLCETVGLGAKRHEPARVLSTGQRKRLELARAMAANPSSCSWTKSPVGSTRRACRSCAISSAASTRRASRSS